MSCAWQCNLYAKFLSRPIGLNLEEDWMVKNIYYREMAGFYKKMIALIVAGCGTACSTGKASTLPPPPPSCAVLQVAAINSLDAKGNPVVSYTNGMSEKICACPDGVVRWGAFCQ